MSGRMEKWLVKLSTFDIKYEPRSAIKSQALANFVVDYSDDLQIKVDLEAKQLIEDEYSPKMDIVHRWSFKSKGNWDRDHIKIATGGHHTPGSQI